MKLLLKLEPCQFHIQHRGERNLLAWRLCDAVAAKRGHKKTNLLLAQRVDLVYTLVKIKLSKILAPKPANAYYPALGPNLSDGLQCYNTIVTSINCVDGMMYKKLYA